MTLALSSCCESVELSLLKDASDLRMIRNAPWMMCSPVTSIEKRKLEVEAAEFKEKLDKIVAHKDSLLEAHVNHCSDLMKEIEEHKRNYMVLELAFEKQKEDNLIQVEITKVATMESRLDFMVKVINKEWEISQAAAEVQKAKEWLSNVSSADYEIGHDGFARNKDFMDDDDMSSTSSE